MKIEVENQGITVTIIGEKAFKDNNNFYNCYAIVDEYRTETTKLYGADTIFREINKFLNAETVEEAVESNELIFKGFAGGIFESDEMALDIFKMVMNMFCNEREKCLMGVNATSDDYELNNLEIKKYVEDISAYLDTYQILNADTENNILKLLFDTAEYDLGRIN